MAEQIHIGFGIDKNFGRFAGITITSLVHNNIQHDLNIHIVYDELLPEDMDRLKKTEQLYRNLTLHFYQITSTEGMTFIVPPGHITQAMYYRYLFVDLLPKSVKRLIYLDADIICKDDILPLWHTDLQGRVLGAVRDWGEDRSCGRIGLKNGRYFNSGVLLMDLVKWRQQKLTQKLFRWLEQVGNTKILWGDQDALNGVIDALIRSVGLGTIPSMVDNGFLSFVMTGMAFSSPMVYGCLGSRNSSPAGACSTIWPVYMTMTVSHSSLTTPKSWVMNKTEE